MRGTKKGALIRRLRTEQQFCRTAGLSAELQDRVLERLVLNAEHPRPSRRRGRPVNDFVLLRVQLWIWDDFLKAVVAAPYALHKLVAEHGLPAIVKGVLSGRALERVLLEELQALTPKVRREVLEAVRDKKEKELPEEDRAMVSALRRDLHRTYRRQLRRSASSHREHSDEGALRNSFAEKEERKRMAKRETAEALMVRATDSELERAAVEMEARGHHQSGADLREYISRRVAACGPEAWLRPDAVRAWHATELHGPSRPPGNNSRGVH